MILQREIEAHGEVVAEINPRAEALESIEPGDVPGEEERVACEVDAGVRSGSGSVDAAEISECRVGDEELVAIDVAVCVRVRGLALKERGV